MRGLVLGLSMVGVGYLIAKKSTPKSAESFAAQALTEFEQTYPILTSGKNTRRKIDFEKVEKFWDAIANPIPTQHSDPKLWEEMNPSVTTVDDLKNIPDAAEYSIQTVYGHDFYYNREAESPDQVGIKWDERTAPHSDFLHHQLGRVSHFNTFIGPLIEGLSKSHEAKKYMNCCPTKELQQNQDWINNTGDFDSYSYNMILRRRGKFTSDADVKSLKASVNAALVAYHTYIDKQGNYVSVNLKTDQDAQEFQVDVSAVLEGRQLLSILATRYFIHEMMKKGGLFEVNPHYAPDRRKRKMFPEADGWYMGPLPSSSYESKANINSYIRLHSRDRITQYFNKVQGTTDNSYLIWCPLLEKEYKRLQSIDYLAFRIYVEKLLFYLQEPESITMLEEETKKLTSSKKQYTTELNAAKRDSSKLVEKFKKGREKEDAINMAAYKKQLAEVTKKAVKRKEKDIKERVLKKSPDKIAALKKGIDYRNQLIQKIQKTEQALKQEYSNNSITISPPFFVRGWDTW